MGDPLSITTGVLGLVGVVLKVSVTAIGMVDKTTGAHEAVHDALRNLRRALQNLNKGTSNMQITLRILISDHKDKAVKKLLALSEGEDAIRELCESLESTRRLLAERAGQAQFETTGLEPLPQDRMSMAFVQAVLKHNLSPSSIQEAILALKDFQFEVESCQQTTELAFQQVWRVYEIVKSRTLQRRFSVSTISTISTMIPESSTGPQMTTSFRKEVIEWLTGQDVAARSNPGARNATAQPSTSAEEYTSASATQPRSSNIDQEMPRTARDRVRDIFGLSSARQDHMKIEPFRVGATAPRTNEYPSSDSAQYANARSGSGSHDNDGEGSYETEGRDKGWARGLFATSKEREREKGAQRELTRMIGFLAATTSDDWTLMLELCERASVNETAAKEAARALRQEFKYSEPLVQLRAVRLWAIMLQNSNNIFITQTASKIFMETVESVIRSQTTSPVVRERLVDVLAAAAFTFRKEGFQSTWKRVRPPNKPEDGIPFDTQDSMFDPTMQGHRMRTHASPIPQVTYVNAPNSLYVPEMGSTPRDWDQGQRNRHRNHELPQPPRKVIPLEEDMRRLFEECSMALSHARILNEALAYATPDSFRNNSVIKEFYGKSKSSDELISAQIPWASAGAARSRENWEGNPGIPDVTKEEELLASLLNAREKLADVFKCYGDLEAASQAEQERAEPERDRGEQKADTTQFQYTSPESVSIPDPIQTRAYSGTYVSLGEPSSSREAGKPSNSRDLPPLPRPYTALAQPRYGHHHFQSSANIIVMPPPPAPHRLPLAASHLRSRTPPPEHQYDLPHQAPQTVPAIAVGAINAAEGVGFPISSPPPSEPRYLIRPAPPPGPPQLHSHYPPSRRVDVGAANAFATEADEETLSPIRPSKKLWVNKAYGERRASLDDELVAEELFADAREEIGLQEVMLRSQSSHVNEETEEENPVREMENF